MNKRAILGAAGGAIVGALLWAVVSYFTGYEIGWIAWAIGGMVGGIARALGSNEKGTAVVCALLAVGSIFVGKMFAFEFTAGHWIKRMAAEALTETYYEEMKADALAFSELKSEDEYASFIEDRDYREEGASGDLTAEEIARFKEESVPILKQIHEEQPSYEDWKRNAIEEMNQSAKATTIDAVISDLGLIDILFALLGIGTAYRLALGQDE